MSTATASPDVAARLRMRVDVLDHVARARSPGGALPVAHAPVAVKLQVREVRAASGGRAHAVERRRDIARDAEVVAVDVGGVRQLQRVTGVVNTPSGAATNH